MKKMKAYTLIELLIVFTIISIIILMTIPNSGYFKSIRENNELKEFKRDVLFARNKAIMDSNIYTLNFLYTKNGYMIEGSKPDSYKKTKFFQHGIVLDKKNSISKILFQVNGTISNSGTISFEKRNGEKYNLIITPVRGLVDIRKVN